MGRRDRSAAGRRGGSARLSGDRDGWVQALTPPPPIAHRRPNFHQGTAAGRAPLVFRDAANLMPAQGALAAGGHFANTRVLGADAVMIPDHVGKWLASSSPSVAASAVVKLLRQQVRTEQCAPSRGS